MFSFTKQNRQGQKHGFFSPHLLGGKIISPFAAKDTSGNEDKHYKQNTKKLLHKT